MKFDLIQHSKPYEVLLDHLSQQPSLAIDLEFDKNRFYYGFTLCLVQIATPDKTFIIDPLSKEIDITKLFPIIEDPRIEKIGFELGEDIRLFKHLNCLPRNVYDVSVCSKLLNYSQISLVNALDTILGIQTSKQSQKSNWFKRPLSQEQLMYAAEDVHYLFQLKAELDAQIEQRGMRAWVAQEQEAVAALNGEANGILSYLKPRDYNGLSQVQGHVIKGLISFREAIAEKNNRPAYQILDKDYLLELVKDPTIIKKFYSDARSLKSLQNQSFISSLSTEMSRLSNEAISLGLSPDLPAIPRHSKEAMRIERARIKHQTELVESVLKPIQAEIKTLYGEHAAVYIMGNRLMNELAEKDLSSLKPYKKELITEIAVRIGVDLSEIGIHD